MYYLPFEFHPNKPELIPNGYPWQTSDVQHDSNWVFVDDIEALQNSFDLTAYVEDQKHQEYMAQQSTYREFGIELSQTSIDAIGAENLRLEDNGTPADTTVLLQQMGGVKVLLETGSIKTARMIINSLIPAFPLYATILQNASNSITDFIMQGGYEN